MAQAFTKSEIRELAEKGFTVHHMAKKLNADEAELESYYIDCFAEDSVTFPLRLLVTKDWLQSQLQHTSVLQLSKRLKTSRSTLNRLMKTYQIENYKLKDILTPEVLYSLYVTQRLTDRQIAEQYNCSVESVKKLKASYSITSADRIPGEDDINLEFFHTLYVKYGFTFAQIADMMNCARHFVINTLRPRLLAQGGPLAEEIVNRQNHTNNETSNKLLLDAVEPIVLFELLKEHSYVKVLEMYDIIPKADKEMELYSEEWLAYWLERYNQKEIAEKFHIGYSFVRDLRKKADIPLPDYTPQFDIDLVKKLYLENDWSIERISKTTGIAKYTVSRILKSNGIKESQRIPLEEKLDQAEFERLYLAEQLTLAQIAILYDKPIHRISNLRHKYGKVNPAILTHKALGATEQRLQFLKKELRFKGLK